MLVVVVVEISPTMSEGVDTNYYVNGGWFMRKDRKRRLPSPTEEGRDGCNGDGGGVVNVTDNSSAAMTMTTDNVDESSTINKATPHSPVSIQLIPSIPASLAPYLGWTKLSSSASCRRRRIRQRQQDIQRARRLMALSDLEEEEEGEGVHQKIDGRAIVSFSIYSSSCTSLLLIIIPPKQIV